MERIPNEDRKKRLTKEDAQKEAGMIRAQLGINTELGKIPTNEVEKFAMLPEGGREPTAEDYDAALAAVEELRELAAKEPASEKVVNLIARLSVEAGALLVYALNARKSVESEEETGKFKDYSTDAALDVLKYKVRFEDAAYKLRKLKGEAKFYDNEKQKERLL